MKKTNLAKALGAILVIGIAVGMYVPATTVQRVLSLLTAAASGPAGEFQLVVSLTYNGSSTYEYKEDISRSDASRAESSPDFARNEFVDRAKKALAAKEGYDQKVYGNDSYKILSGVRVNSVKIKDSRSGRATDIFRSARSRDSENALID